MELPTGQERTVAGEAGYLAGRASSLSGQIVTGIRQALLARQLRPGDFLGTEKDIALRFGVSRMTLRQALDSLARRGLVVRTVGRRGGTFASAPKTELDMTVVAGLTAQLRRQGHRAGARVLSAEEGPCGSRTAAALALEPGDPVFEVVRVRLSDDEPAPWVRTRPAEAAPAGAWSVPRTWRPSPPSA